MASPDDLVQALIACPRFLPHQQSTVVPELYELGLLRSPSGAPASLSELGVEYLRKHLLDPLEAPEVCACGCPATGVARSTGSPSCVACEVQRRTLVQAILAKLQEPADRRESAELEQRLKEEAREEFARGFAQHFRKAVRACRA